MPFSEVKSQKIFVSPSPYSQATQTQTNKVLHISGQVAQGFDGKTIARGDIVGQTEAVIENIETIVMEQGGSLADVCKITVFVTSRDELSKVRDVRRRKFKVPYPATTTVIVAGLANEEWMIEIEAIAALP